MSQNRQDLSNALKLESHRLDTEELLQLYSPDISDSIQLRY